MTGNVFEAVKNAREFFCIQDFPGNLFTLLEKGDYAEKYKMLLFKEDIGKLSGFIGYGGDGFTVICINYKRPIGHQNFTLAHELGHWFLHKGQNISDEDKHIYSGELQEKEASNFASEVLYPERFIEQDYCDILHKGLLQPDKRKDLAISVDALCKKYCLSFAMVLRNILYKGRQDSQYNSVHKQIEKSLGCKISEYFEKDFYVPNDERKEYQRLMTPYLELEKKIDILVSRGKIGKATAESIKLRNGIGVV
ncbi:MAG: ImmA/IrrE family metallo-endopeptidase [Lachnospiraceae bacterium]|nr:ImmA/IrrE family metallo-endopeptidase [Lachnospiraceae bacterium]